MDKEHENSLRKNTHIHKQAKCFINYQGMQKLNIEVRDKFLLSVWQK